MGYVEADGYWWVEALALLGTAPDGAAGPARTHQAGWLQTWYELLESEPGPTVRLAAKQGFVLTRAQAQRSGLSDGAVRRLVRRQEWTVPRRGVLCPLPPRTDGRPHGRGLEVTMTAAALSRRGTVISHESAAILHGLPVLERPDRPRLTRAHVSRAGGWTNCLIHAAPIHVRELDRWFGTPLTTVARTIVDIARSAGTGAGLVVADAALHEGMVSWADLHDSRRRGRRRPGITQAARVVELADGRAESPLESLTRLCLIDGGLPNPEPQARIRTHRGTYRVDLLFAAQRVVVEADGRRKYRTDPAGGGDPLWNEKLRQEAIERAGYRVVRVTWDDVLNHPAETVARVLRALNATLAIV